MIQLTVAGQVYNYPSENDSPNWGEEATAWAQGVTDALGAVFGPFDIPETIATIANNQVVPANVIGLSFDTTKVRGSIVTYTVYRVSTGSGAMEAGETGTMYLTYLNNTNVWNISVVGGSFGQVQFSITVNGQIQYTSSNFTGTGYSGVMHFKASSLAQ